MRERLYIDDETYFALPYASNSGMKDADKLFSASNSAGDWVPTKAFEFGSALDALLTNPVLTDTSMLTDDERQRLGPMRRSLYKDEMMNLFFPINHGTPTPNDTQYQVVWVEKEFEVDLDGLKVIVPAKCKFDFWNPKFDFGSDLKTLACKDEASFESAFKFFQYPMQAAWYMDTSKTDRFLFFGVSKMNFRVFRKAIKRGDAIYKEGLALYTKYIKSWCKLNGFKRAK